MAEIQTMRYSFGGGLDRAAGAMDVRPGSFRDLRNAVLSDGRARARKGMQATAQLVDETGAPLTHGCGIFAFRHEGVAIAVGYSAADRRVHVNRLQADGTAPEWIGVWFTALAAAGVPRVFAAELNGRLFLAHDEARPARRASTYVYNPLGTPPLAPLTADVDGDTVAEELKFRGVAQHLSYVFGWGHGSAEVVRHCLPGQALVFKKNDYAPFGATGDPVLCALSAGPLFVLKQTEVHALLGHSVRTFAPRLLDPVFGPAASRLAVNVGGRVFFWSLQGPRMITGGGASEDLAVPLDLGAPLPPDLAPMGLLDDGYAEYDPDRQMVLFTFGALVYALSLRTEPWRWHFDELGRTLRAGARVYSRPTEPAPEGHPEAAATTAITGTSATANWTNVDADGDETVEVWLKPGAGAWERKTSVVATTAAAQSTVLSGLTAGTVYDMAFRYRRGGAYTPGYTSDDPAEWPASSRTSFTTGAPASATIQTASWSRTGAAAEQIALSLTLADPTLQTRILRSTTGNVADAVLVETLAAGDTSCIDASVGGEVGYTYWVRHLNGDGTDALLSAPFAAFSGPSRPVVVDLWSNTSTAYHIDFNTAAGTTLHYDDLGGAMAFVQALAEGSTTLARSVPEGTAGVTFRLRAEVVSFGVTDYSAYTEGSAFICGACPPYQS